MILPFSFLTPSQKRRRVCPTDAVGVLVVGVLVGVRVYGDLPGVLPPLISQEGGE